MSNQVAPVVREYIEIGAGYVVATKGDGSTYRIHAPDDAERVIVLPEFYHPFYTQMAKAIAAERAAASGELERLRAHLSACLDWMESLRASGDAGFWNWDADDAYTKARTALEGGDAP